MACTCEVGTQGKCLSRLIVIFKGPHGCCVENRLEGPGRQQGDQLGGFCLSCGDTVVARTMLAVGRYRDGFGFWEYPEGDFYLSATGSPPPRSAAGTMPGAAEKQV